MMGFSNSEDHDLFRNIALSLDSMTLELTRIDVFPSEGELSDRTESLSHESTALHYAWQRCLAYTDLERLTILFPEVTGDNTRYGNKLWLYEAILEQGFSRRLKKLWLDGAVFDAIALGEFMIRHASTLEDVILVNAICNYPKSLASMIKVMRNRLNLKRCEIIMHHRWHLEHDPEDMPTGLRDLLSLYAADDGPIPDLYRVDLGLYVMGKETRGCTLSISPYESDEESNHGHMNEDSDLEAVEADEDEDEEEEEDQDHTDLGDNEVTAIE